MSLYKSTRRHFMRDAGSFAVASMIIPGSVHASEQTVPPTSMQAQSLPDWTPGILEIHHISTGRGSCAFLICPDATIWMIDAGSKVPEVQPQTEKYLIDAKPNDTLRPGQWIARYARWRMAQAGRDRIDYFLLTHLHDDHMGQIYPGNFTLSPRSKFGNYQLGGLMDVAEEIPIDKIIDRGFPDYSYPSPLNDPQQSNYRAFVRSYRERGGKLERFRPGTATQIGLLHKKNQYPSFSVRNLAANGEIWTGVDEQTKKVFPDLSSLSPDQYPTENKCSSALRLSYGKFDYFAGGDMDHELRYGRLPWGDIESQVARICGPVDVAVANHHGWRDACGPEWVAALRPQAFIINAWDSAHPTMNALENMLSRELYPGNRDIYATAIKPESKIAIRRLAELKSDNGHIVIRVDPNGDKFQIFILTNKDESRRVIAKSDPYRCA